VNDTPTPSDATTPNDPTTPAPAGTGSGALRLPSRRAGAVLAAAMLAAGVAVGAAIGPAPETSLAGNAATVKQLPALIAALAAQRRTAATPQTTPTAVKPPAITPAATPAAAPSAPASTTVTPAQASTPSSSGTSETEPSSPAPVKKPAATTTLPAITSVWLIQLSGVSFAQALASPTTAPYITGQLIPKGTLLSGWSALSGSAFANDAAVAEHASALSAPPPLLHTIVQPPCPEGAAGAACAAGTPGQLTAADEFLKATLASITATTTYSEHGLVVVTFATVGNATASELPAGASTATLTSQPPAGVVLLSPFAKAGARPTTTFNPTSPQQSLEKLLR
jgi:hypothetical protein